MPRAAAGRRDRHRPAAGRVDGQGGARAYRRSRLRLTAGLLLVWGLAAFAGVYFARQLNQPFYGWPFGFFWAALGAPLSFVAIVAVYAWRMAVLDRRLERDKTEEGMTPGIRSSLVERLGEGGRS